MDNGEYSRTEGILEMANSLTLMTIHAHPDDEAIGTGGILKRYSNRGIQTVLVLATKGEAGEIDGRVPVGDERAHTADLRLRELQCSREILGITRVHFLDYRDSGMAGSLENKQPGAFAAADPEEATKRLVRIIRQEKPHVITTYNQKGTYGHPDHIAVNQITMRAFRAASRSDCYQDLGLRPWHPAKLYHQVIPLSRIRKMVGFMKARAEQLGIDPEFMGTEDQTIHTWVDIRNVLEDKFAAIRCHKSQVGENGFFDQFTESQRRELFGFECFIWVAGNVKPREKESDLFEGINNATCSASS
jgi:LmbE family N-acetylglucosaminyl deacetylase